MFYSTFTVHILIFWKIPSGSSAPILFISARWEMQREFQPLLLTEQMVYQEETKPKFSLSFINFFLLFFCFLWFMSEWSRLENLWSPPFWQWHIEQFISKTNIIMNWISVCVCGPTLGCLWRCPRSNPPASTVNRRPFSIPRSPEMKRPFFAPLLSSPVKQCRGIGSVSIQPAPLRSHQAWVEAPLFFGNCAGKRQNVHHWGADKKNGIGPFV